MTHEKPIVALILGGSTGMGKETAKRLLQRGVDVHLVARDSERLTDAKEELGTLGTVTTTGVDLYDREQVKGLVADLRQRQEHIKYLVNAAGYFFPKAFLDHTDEDFDRYHELNRATFLVTQAVAENMKANGGGSIVNIGSMWAKQAIAATPSSAYSMAKAGLHSLTQHLTGRQKVA